MIVPGAYSESRGIDSFQGCDNTKVAENAPSLARKISGLELGLVDPMPVKCDIEWYYAKCRGALKQLHKNLFQQVMQHVEVQFM